MVWKGGTAGRQTRLAADGCATARRLARCTLWRADATKMASPIFLARSSNRRSGCEKITNWPCLKATRRLIGSVPSARACAGSRKRPRPRHCFAHVRLWRIWAQVLAMSRCAVVAGLRGLRRWSRLWAGRRALVKSSCALRCKGWHATMKTRKPLRSWWVNTSAHNRYS